MEGILMLSILSLCMFGGCFIAGLIPLSISLSESKLHRITVLGAGLLVGTALSVIIPEGVNSLYTNNPDAAPGHQHSLSPVRRNLHEDVVESQKENPFLEVDKDPVVIIGDGSALSGYRIELHSYIGISLVFGFVFMLLVDQLGSRFHSPHPPVASTVLPDDTPSSPTSPRTSHSVLTATIGLTVHAAADGVALGASGATTRSDVELIVFIAIMLHKAPAAFGLVTFLLHDSLDRKTIRKHLLVFSLAAPVLAVFTFLALTQFGGSTDAYGTGIAMLFSAGTFLYVSTVHILPEVQARNNGRFSKVDLLILVVGSFLPLLLSVSHSH